MDLSLAIPYDRELFSAFASEVREKILKLVSQRPMSIVELAKKLNISSPAMIRHIKVLQKARLIRIEVAKHVRGKPKTVMPGKRIFAEGVYRFFKSPEEIPLYLRAVLLISNYREIAKEIKNGGFDEDELKYYTTMLITHNSQETNEMSSAEKEKRLLEFLKVDSRKISFEIKQWIELKFDDYRSKKEIPALVPPSNVREFDFKRGLVIDLGPHWSLQEIKRWQERGVKFGTEMGYGQGGRQTEKMAEVLGKCLKILMLYNKKILLKKFNLDDVNAEQKLEEAGTPLAMTAMMVLEELKIQIPPPEPKIIEAWGQTYLKIKEVLKTMNVKADEEKKAWEKRNPKIPQIRRQDSAAYYLDLEFVKKATELCLNLIEKLEEKEGPLTKAAQVVQNGPIWKK